MERIIITAEVVDGTKWEKGFKTHADLFRSQGSTAMHYTVTHNQVALYTEVTDLDTFLKVFKSPETAEAMTHDGVRKETVKVYVFDKELPL